MQNGHTAERPIDSLSTLKRAALSSSSFASKTKMLTWQGRAHDHEAVFPRAGHTHYTPDELTT